MIQEIFRMLNQFAVEIPTLPERLSIPPGIGWGGNDTGRLKECRAAEKGRQAFGTHMVYRETLLPIQLRPLQHLIHRNWIHGVPGQKSRFSHPQGKEWETNTRSRSEMPVWTVSQKFFHLQCRRLFKDFWGRPTTTADFRSSFWQIPYTGNVCLLEDKIQDWGMYLFTISHGSYALDQRSGDGWFSEWFNVFVIF